MSEISNLTTKYFVRIHQTHLTNFQAERLEKLKNCQCVVDGQDVTFEQFKRMIVPNVIMEYHTSKTFKRLVMHTPSKVENYLNRSSAVQCLEMIKQLHAVRTDELTYYPEFKFFMGGKEVNRLQFCMYTAHKGTIHVYRIEDYLVVYNSCSEHPPKAHEQEPVLFPNCTNVFPKKIGECPKVSSPFRGTWLETV